MIITNLIGGLGNQMFQYAAARALSLHLGVPLLLDTSDFAGYELHQGYELSRIFQANMAVASSGNVCDMIGWQSNRFLKRLCIRSFFKYLRSKNFIVEPHFNYWPKINAVLPGSYLYGYWQSELYFKKIEDIIRSDFEFKLPLDNLNHNISNHMKNSNSISVHIRRGDYVQNSANLQRHGICSPGYYHAAINFIIQKVNNPIVFIFSDDITWSKNNINLDIPVYFIGHNSGYDSYKDLQLMTMCKHHIIANSSFSWWGAWLGYSPDQIVVAPQPWFEDIKLDARDLILDSWHLFHKNL